MSKSMRRKKFWAMQKITPFLGFDNQAEAAADFYTSVFKDSGILNITRYGESGPTWFVVHIGDVAAL